MDSLSHVGKENAMSRNENNSCGKPGELYGCVGYILSHVAKQSATSRYEGNNAEKKPGELSQPELLKPPLKQSYTVGLTLLIQSRVQNISMPIIGRLSCHEIIC